MRLKLKNRRIEEKGPNEPKLKHMKACVATQKSMPQHGGHQLNSWEWCDATWPFYAVTC